MRGFRYYQLKAKKAVVRVKIGWYKLQVKRLQAEIAVLEWLRGSDEYHESIRWQYGEGVDDE